MDKAIQDALNEQINAELHSAYIYLAMSAHFAEQNLDGFSHWMRHQADEELEHAMKLFDYVLERGGHVELKAVAGPPKKFGTPLQIFETALAHEKKISAMIHALYDLARKKKDFATENQLNWFVTEQVEEEDNAGKAVERLKLAGDSTAALLMLDHQFGKRSEED
ncbi:MAG: ferritin [Longimicrobiales bacterium]|nr:ferritin [Longimicrobiales bacterium]